MLKCPSCGGELKYDTLLKKVKCKYCASAFDVEELIDKIKAAQEEKGEKYSPNEVVKANSREQEPVDENNSYEGKSYKCTQCGATLLTFDDTAITFCSYCGSQAMLEEKMVRQNNPDVVIPFKKSKEECIEAYRKKVEKFLFAPKYMQSNTIVDKFRGIYMPYGIYYLSHEGNLVNTGEKYAYRRGDYVYYNQYLITAHNVDISYEGISFDLVSKFYDNFSMSIPFDYRDAIAFNPAYLAGYYADSLDVKKTVYERAAAKIAEPDAAYRLKQEKVFKMYGCSNPKVTFYYNNKSKVGMFPVYFLAIRNQENDAVHYAVVNGQTGEVAIELPIDFKKYVLLSIIIAAFFFVGMNAFVTLKPGKVLGFSFIASIVCLIFSLNQLSRIDKKRTHQDDAGVVSVDKKISKRDIVLKKNSTLWTVLSSSLLGALGASFLMAMVGLELSKATVKLGFMIAFLVITFLIVKYRLKSQRERREKNVKLLGEKFVKEREELYVQSKKTRFKFLRKEILALVLPIVVFLSGTIEDNFFYAATIASFVLSILSFYDLVREHNILVSNKLPQLEKRGGDENE